jgi:hypothetical protein
MDGQARSKSQSKSALVKLQAHTTEEWFLTLQKAEERV